jgi:xylan 1,4-beta-xylosidase
MAEFFCDLSAPTQELRHFWETCVGSGHSTLALRADYQAHLRRCHEELGFQRVRFHGWLMDELGITWSQDDAFAYSFFNADRIVDFLQSIGMSPFVELSFMPECLASGRKTVFHYRANVTPPRDDKAWATLIRKLLSHWVDTYGAKAMREWYFEVWNEPNLKSFWTASKARYLSLYEHTARAVKDLDSMFSVGGPATAQNQWIPSFLDFCEAHGLPADFVSTHHYPNDPPFDKAASDTEHQLAATHRSMLREQLQKAHRQARGRPLIYTEWNSSSDDRDALHDDSYAAAFIVKTILEANGLVAGYSYWVFSDIFTEHPIPAAAFHGGFGLMNVHGVPKPAYRAFQLLHGLGHELCHVDGRDATADAWVVRDGQRATVVLSNFALPRHPIDRERVRVTLTNGPSVRAAHVQRIDEDHANARTVWGRLGKPAYLSRSQIACLDDASQLEKETIAVRQDRSAVSMTLDLPPQSVAAITLEFAAAGPQG